MIYYHPPSENTQQCTLTIIHALSDCDHSNIVGLEVSITITKGQNVDTVQQWPVGLHKFNNTL